MTPSAQVGFRHVFPISTRFRHSQIAPKAGKASQVQVSGVSCSKTPPIRGTTKGTTKGTAKGTIQGTIKGVKGYCKGDYKGDYTGDYKIGFVGKVLTDEDLRPVHLSRLLDLIPEETSPKP